MAKSIKIGVVIYRNCTSSMVAGFWDIMVLANQLHYQQFNKNLLSIELIAETNSPIKCFSGLNLIPHKNIKTKEQFDLLYVPGFIGDVDQVLALEKKTIHYLSTIKTTKTILTAACNGNFFLASSGALKNKNATTHWSLIDKFRKDFQNVNLQPEKIIVDNGNVISAAGVTSYFNLALHIIQRLTNPEISLACAKIFLVDSGRKIQTPYQIFQFPKNHGDDVIAKTQNWLERNFKEKTSLTQLSEVGNVSIKTLTRRFKKATGETPQIYLQKFRIETAKRLLESKDITFNEVTWQVGYNDPSSFHKAFKIETGLTPIDYRNKFSFL
ncbi:MAG: helix-turn-helix domain-containing protein [Cyclobacteriaceae bacterium]|nr:helix-turn-helix domain-containing protein [Cyclobacteriaceae bacterium]